MRDIYERNIQDIQIIESVETNSLGGPDQHKKNVEVLIPFRNQKYIPDYLIDFIQNDPNFYPEICTNNLEDTYL